MCNLQHWKYDSQVLSHDTLFNIVLLWKTTDFKE